MAFKFDFGYVYTVEKNNKRAVMHSWLLMSMSPMPMISNPRLYSSAQPDQKYPIQGVFLPDLGI